MRKRNIFQVAFSIYEEPHFLTLPTSEFEIQDLLQRLHLNHENVKYPYGFRIQDNTKEYLEPAMLGKDVFKINKLAQKLSDMTEEKETAFEINIKNSMANGIFPDIDDLLTLASYQSENMVLHKGITNDEQLGRNMANHVIQEMSGKIEKWKDNKEISQQLFDVFGKLYRLEHKGCFTSQGFAECQDEQNTFMKQADDEQTGCISLIIFGDKNSAKLMLPANGNEKERVKSILGVQDLGLRYECSGCIIPALAPVIEEAQDFQRTEQFADILKQLDEDGELTKYKAIVDIVKCVSLEDAIALSEQINQYDFYAVQDKREYTISRMKEAKLVTEQAIREYQKFTHSDESYINTDNLLINYDNASKTDFGFIKRNDRMPIEEFAKDNIQTMDIT